jgi:hypothetical protein
LFGNLSRVPLIAIEHKTSSPFEIIHSDVWGPSSVLSYYGHKYFVLFINDYTRYTWVYVLKNKSEVYNVFLNFEQLVEQKFKSKIRDFHSDWEGGENINGYMPISLKLELNIELLVHTCTNKMV